MNKAKLLPLIALFPLLAGCGGSITLDSAIADAQTSLLRAQARARAEGTVGLYPCQLTATFNVGATNSVGLAAGKGSSPFPVSVPGPTLGLSDSKGSTVSIVFKSPECGAVVHPGDQPIAAPHD